MTVVASPYFSSYVAIGNSKHRLMPIVNVRLLQAFIPASPHIATQGTTLEYTCVIVKPKDRALPPHPQPASTPNAQVVAS